ncbi:MAG TPA: hypothetical protein DDY43_08735, partial [Synechococcales bacterium UBA10510]|nr:hypothetical protein [Synechococcales bacterium UBA10510]
MQIVKFLKKVDELLVMKSSLLVFPRAELGNQSEGPQAESAVLAALTSGDPLSTAVLSAAAATAATGAPSLGDGSTNLVVADGAPRTCNCLACQRTNSVMGDEIPEPIASLAPTGGATVLTSRVDLGYTFKLHSHPTATKTIYLDFDGYVTTDTYWNTYKGLSSIATPKYDFDGNINVFSNDELERIQFIWQRVAEDFAPFNINVTTEDPGAAALTKGDVAGDTTWGTRVVIGGSCHDWFGIGAGGVSYVNVFGDGSAGPSFVFKEQLGNGHEKATAEAISHEVGHALGLVHDGTSGAGYYTGQGSGNTGWAPIMGAGYYQPVTQWSKGEYKNANNKEDDLAIISSSTNGAGYRADDYGNSAASATALSGLSFSQFGIIETSDDSDWFSFCTGTGNVTLSITNACQAWINNGSGNFSSALLTNRSPNLDIAAYLYSSDGNLVATSSPLASLAASFNLNLSAGIYLLKVIGVGFGDPLTNGYSNYSSLGQYLISGIISIIGSLGLAGFSDTGFSSSDGISNDNNFSLLLSDQQAGTTVVFQSSTNGGTTWIETTSIQSNLADGSYQFRAQVSNAAGDMGYTNIISITLDTSAPTAPALA